MNAANETKRTQAEPNDRCPTSVNHFPIPRKASPMNTKNSAFFATKFLLLLFVFVGAQLFSMQSAMAAPQPYTKLPPEVAEEMKWMAWNAAWAAANHRFVSTLEGAKGEEHFNKHSEEMKKKAVGLEGVSQSTLDDIKWLAWNAAWSTANGRSALRYFFPTDQVYWLNEAAKNAKAANEHLQRVKNSGQLAPELVQSITEMVGRQHGMQQTPEQAFWQMQNTTGRRLI